MITNERGGETINTSSLQGAVKALLTGLSVLDTVGTVGTVGTLASHLTLGITWIQAAVPRVLFIPLVPNWCLEERPEEKNKLREQNELCNINKCMRIQQIIYWIIYQIC